MNLEDMNGWWKTGRIGEEWEIFRKRELFSEVLKYIKDRQIIVITGLRRTGKTVLMYHLIEHLIKNNTNPINILYFSFDLGTGDIEETLARYKEITSVDYKKEKIFAFLDEVQKLEGWEDKIKLVYDNYPNIKFFISGSSGLFIEKKTKESLAGRAFGFQLLPLKFEEYIFLKGKEVLVKKKNMFRDEIRDELKHYIASGGFPEIMNEKDEAKIKKYIKELIVDKIVYIDVPKVFEIEEPELLERLIALISASPGMIIDYDSLASDLQRNRKTISNYLYYLEKSFVIRKLYNFSKNLLTSEKKKKRFYPASTALALLYGAEYGALMETAALQNSDFKFFFRKGEKEVDFVAASKKSILPVEIKSGKKLRKNIEISLIYFMSKFKVEDALVITEDYEGKRTSSWFGKKGRIKFVPLWKWLLEEA